MAKRTHSPDCRFCKHCWKQRYRRSHSFAIFWLHSLSSHGTLCNTDATGAPLWHHRKAPSQTLYFFVEFCWLHIPTCFDSCEGMHVKLSSFCIFCWRLPITVSWDSRQLNGFSGQLSKPVSQCMLRRKNGLNFGPVVAYCSVLTIGFTFLSSMNTAYLFVSNCFVYRATMHPRSSPYTDCFQSVLSWRTSTLNHSLPSFWFQSARRPHETNLKHTLREPMKMSVVLNQLMKSDFGKLPFIPWGEREAGTWSDGNLNWQRQLPTLPARSTCTAILSLQKTCIAMWHNVLFIYLEIRKVDLITLSKFWLDVRSKNTELKQPTTVYPYTYENSKNCSKISVLTWFDSIKLIGIFIDLSILENFRIWFYIGLIPRSHHGPPTF